MKTENLYHFATILNAIAFSTMVAIYSEYLITLELSYAHIAMVNIAYWGTIVLAEIPTGIKADEKGRAWAIMWGFILKSVGFGLYAFAFDFWSALISETVIGLGAAFTTGAMRAWLTDAVLNENRSFTIVEKAIYKNGWLARIVTIPIVLLAAYYASVDGEGSLFRFRMIWGFSCVIAITGAYIAYQFMLGKGEPKKKLSSKQLLIESLERLKSSYDLKWLLACNGIVGLVLPFNHYWQPFFTQYVSLAWCGPLYTVFIVTVAIGAGIIAWRSPTNGEIVKCIFASHLTIGLGLILIAFTYGVWYALAAAIIHEIGRGAFDPCIHVYIQSQIESEYRATYGSIHSLGSRLNYGIILCIVSFTISDMESKPENIRIIWIIAGSLLTILGIILFFLRPRHD